MRINWKLRFKNKVTFSALIWVIFLIMYQILSILGIAVPVSEDSISELITLIINMFAVIGIIVDPTTANINDSERAMGYEEPKE